jgi:hypothetical protein
MPVSASPKGNYTVTGTIQPPPLASRKGTLPKRNMIQLLGGSLPLGNFTATGNSYIPLTQTSHKGTSHTSGALVSRPLKD